MPCPHLTELIMKKRNGGTLSSEDIAYFIGHIKKSQSSGTSQQVADPSQIGSMLMAIFFKGMNDEETQALTSSMKNSGFVFSWPDKWKHLVVDKHSTGGVGDKVSLVLAPALAAVGLKVPMISGRSLGHTGGTLDKLESIPGYCVEQTAEAIMKQVEEIGCCIVGQTDDIVPADRIIYHTRDITATVDQPSLITASIVSKKLAESVDSLVYDVKFGKGSMFKSEKEALEMAKRLVTASSKESKCAALFTDMNCPIGNEIGNSREVLESVRCMQDKGPVDLIELVEQLGSELLYMTGQAADREEGIAKINEVLGSGEALKKFHDMLIYQGVSKETAHTLCYGDASSVLPSAKCITGITYNGPSGFVNAIDASVLAKVWRQLMDIASGPNLAAGLTIKKHVEDKMESGDVWLEVHHNGPVLEANRIECLNQALVVGSSKEGTRRRVRKRIHFAGKETEVEVCDIPVN